MATVFLILGGKIIKLKSIASLLIVAVALLTALSWSSYGQMQRPLEKVWEYKIERELINENGSRRIFHCDVRDMNECGAQGWELVAVVVQADHKTFYFKRAKG
jgi:hypothetical protein